MPTLTWNATERFLFMIAIALGCTAVMIGFDWLEQTSFVGSEHHESFFTVIRYLGVTIKAITVLALIGFWWWGGIASDVVLGVAGTDNWRFGWGAVVVLICTCMVYGTIMDVAGSRPIDNSGNVAKLESRLVKLQQELEKAKDERGLKLVNGDGDTTRLVQAWIDKDTNLFFLRRGKDMPPLKLPKDSKTIILADGERWPMDPEAEEEDNNNAGN